MYWHGRLVIPTFQRFCSSQQVAREALFPLVLLQAKVVGLIKRNRTYAATGDECLMMIAESFGSETDVQNQQEIKKLLFGLIIRLFVFVSLSWVFRLVSSVFVNDF
jgi:hypothetical protein